VRKLGCRAHANCESDEGLSCPARDPGVQANLAASPEALPLMRIIASWSRSRGSTEYKYAARCSAPSWRAPLRSSWIQTTSADAQKQSVLPRSALDGKIPIQVVGHGAAATGFERQPRLGAVERVMDRCDFSPLFRWTIGLDRLTGLVDAATRVDSAAVAYPPYDIEKTGEDAYRLTLMRASLS